MEMNWRLKAFPVVSLLYVCIRFLALTGYTVHQLALTCTILDKLTSGNIPTLYEMEKLNRDCTPSERDTNRLFIPFRLWLFKSSHCLY